MVKKVTQMLSTMDHFNFVTEDSILNQDLDVSINCAVRDKTEHLKKQIHKYQLMLKTCFYQQAIRPDLKHTFEMNLSLISGDRAPVAWFGL